MGIRKAMTGLLVLCTTAVAPLATSEPVAASAKSAPECEPYAGVEQLVSLAQTHVIILGEAIHGTRESPAALLSLACVLAEEGPVTIGLEAEHSQSAGLSSFLDDPTDLAALLNSTAGMWSVHDGRSSQAILDLLRHLSVLKRRGGDIDVFSFDASYEEDYKGQSDWGMVGRDAVMASQVNQLLLGTEGAVVLLTGGFHAQKHPFAFGDETFVPMASQITVRPVLSLQMKHAGGRAWMTGEVDGKPFTGEVQLQDMLPASSPEKAFTLDTDGAQWDGAYFTGPITASPPAFPAASDP